MTGLISFSHRMIFLVGMKCVMLSFMLSCVARKSTINQSETGLRGAGGPMNTLIPAPGKTPVFAFWDNGFNGYAAHLDLDGANLVKGVNSRFLQGGNVKNFLNQSSPDLYEFHLVHMNPAEYNENFLFEILDRKKHSGIFPDAFFRQENLGPELSQLVDQKMKQAEVLLGRVFSGPQNETPEQKRIRLAEKLEKVKDAYLMRAYIAEKMTKRDLVEPSLIDGDSVQDIQKFKKAVYSKTQLFNYAAVPLSDFVRLGLLTVYGGFWTDSTVSINTDLNHYKDLLNKNSKELVIYFNTFYRQDTGDGPGSTLADITGGETWWLNTKGPGNELVMDWKKCANDYWLEKDPSLEIEMHPLFKKGNGVPVHLGKIPDRLRNYLWIYFCWSRVALAKPELAKSTVLALPALALHGPYAFLSLHGGQTSIVKYGAEMFFKEEPLEQSFFAHINSMLLKEAAAKYVKWIDAMRIIKIPGAVAKKFDSIYTSAAQTETLEIPAQSSAQSSTQSPGKSPNVFEYIWNKK